MGIVNDTIKACAYNNEDNDNLPVLRYACVRKDIVMNA